MRACLSVQASPNLNLYEGQAHAVTLYLFPLTGTLGFEEALPPAAEHVGIVADYYRDAGDEEGVRRLIVPAHCGFFSETRVMLSPHDLLLEK